jgi:hypothetical protein
MTDMKNEKDGSIREEDIPDILKNPPWPIGEPIVAILEPLPDEEAIVWPQKLEALLDRIRRKDDPPGKTPEELLRELHIKDSAHARILQGGAPTPDDFDRVQYRGLSLDVRPLASLPPRAALAIWQSTPVKYWSDYYSHEFSDDLYFLLRKLGPAFVPGLVKFAFHHLEDRVRLLLPCRSARVVPVIASALANTRHARDAAQEWLSAYPDTAARALIPAALGENRKPREDALTALLWLAQNGFEDVIKTVAMDYVDATSGKARSFPRRRTGLKPEPVSWTPKFLSSIEQARLDERPPENSDPADDAEPALISAGNTGLAAALTRLTRNPRLFLYAQMSGLPDFFVPGAFRRPQLKAGGALPNPALTVLGQMLAIGAWFETATGQSAGEPFAWFAEIKAVCVPESLSDFVWDVFEAWHSAGMPPGGKWTLFALGQLGHDSSAVRLASRIRQWEADKKRARVISGMDMLEAIGTDAALTYLNGLAYQFRKQNLRDVARQKIERIAEARGLSADQLADRLAPDLGLDANGGLRLDFGPRQFFLGFDESLKLLCAAAHKIFLC